MLSGAAKVDRAGVNVPWHSMQQPHASQRPASVPALCEQAEWH